MFIFPNLLTKNSTTDLASFSASSSVLSSRHQTQQNLALTMPTSSSGYVAPPLDFGNCKTPPTSANSASRRNSTVDDCGRFCALPHSDGTPEVN